MKPRFIPFTSTAVASPPAESEPWLSTAASADHLGVSSITIRRWIKQGRLKPKRTPSGEYRFRRSDLDAILV